MKISVNQLRITFKEVTIQGTKEFSTKWYDFNFFDLEKIIEKYKGKQDFKIITR